MKLIVTLLMRFVQIITALVIKILFNSKILDSKEMRTLIALS